MASVNTTFRHLSWSENTVHEKPANTKLTRADVRIAFEGDMAGESVVEYVMAYQQDGTAAFAGVERFIGAVNGRKGSFAIRHVGHFADGKAHARLDIIEGSGTDDLAGITGHADFAAGHAESYPLQFEIDLPSANE